MKDDVIISSEDYLIGSLVKDYPFVVNLCETVGFRGKYIESATGRAIWQAAESLASRGIAIDPASIVETIETSFKHIDATAASSLILKSISLANNPHKIMFHLKKIREKYKRRGAIDLFTEGIDYLSDNSDVDDTISKVKHKLAEMERETTVVEESLEDKRERIKARYSGVRSTGTSGIKSRWVQVQQTLGSYMFGKITVIGARPKMGKSTFALNEALNTSFANNIPSLYFSIEMDEEELLEKAASDITEMDNFKLKQGEYSDSEIEKFMRLGVDPAMKSCLEVIDNPSMTIEQICTKTREMVSEQAIRLVIVDYLQLISSTPGSRFQSKTYEIAYWMNQLRILAKETNAAIIVLSQISRPPKGMNMQEVSKMNAMALPMPTMNDLRDSGSIEQDAYGILIIGPPQVPNPQPSWHNAHPICVRVEANRGGRTGDVEMMFNKPCNKFMSFTEYEKYREAIYAKVNAARTPQTQKSS